MHYPSYRISIKRHDAPMKPYGFNDETGEPEYEEWEDGKPRAFFRCAIEGQQDEKSEAMIQHMETHCFLPGDEARTLAGILFQAAGSLNALAGFLSEEPEWRKQSTTIPEGV